LQYVLYFIHPQTSAPYPFFACTQAGKAIIYVLFNNY